MQKLISLGSSGARSESMVDVRLLRSRCLGLENGATVSSLLEAQTRRDRSYGVKHSEQAMYKSASLPACLAGQSSATNSLLRRPSPAVINERRKTVQMQKKAQVAESTLRRLFSMRSDVPDTVTERFGVLRHKSRGGSKCWQDDPRITIAENLRRSCALSGGGQNRRMPRSFTRDLGDDQLMPQTSPQIRKYWAAARALVQWLIVYFVATRRHRAIDKVKVLLRHVGEWSRMRCAIHKLTTSVKKFQTVFREYRATKQMHLDTLETVWQEVEDDFLHSYFRLYFKQLFDSSKAETGGLDHQISKQMVQMRRSSLIERVLDWHKFRIPAKDRREAIEQFYGVRQKRRVHNRDNFLSTIMSASCWQKDLEQYMSQLGTDFGNHDHDFEMEAEVSKSKAVEADQLAWWHMPEETVLSLISLLAKGLKETEPFQDHPANNAVLEKVVSAPTKETESMKRSAPAWLDFHMVEEVGNISRDSRKTTFLIQAKITTHTQKEDLDHVLHGFTPRMKEMTERMAEVMRANPGSSAAALGHNLRRPSIMADAGRQSSLLEESGTASVFYGRRAAESVSDSD
mmetsp:Transcript_70032/g.124174  ORF Transcript_70032/g.124174 Transcript_70032/m.124174 type:complete len:571 (+) Transcript_70032:1-1713(+)